MNEPGPAQASMVDRMACLTAAGGGLGYLPKAPGTFGSMLGPVMFATLQQFLPEPRWISFGLAGCLCFLIGVWLSQRAISVSGLKDPQFVVCDEFFAFAWVYMYVPITGVTAVLGFILFRLFDITKPGPVSWAERLPGGWGVMADDAVAAVFAGGCLWGLTQLVPM